MSISYVREALELFNDDVNGEVDTKHGERKKGDNVNIASVRKIRRKKFKKKPEKNNFVKASKNAFDEQWRYTRVDRTQTNLQFLKEQELFHAADAKTVDTIVEHQKRHSSKFDTSKNNTLESTASVFTDRDFDKFEEEYVF